MWEQSPAFCREAQGNPQGRGGDAQAPEDWTCGSHDRPEIEGPTEAELESQGEKRKGISSDRGTCLGAGKVEQIGTKEGLECRTWKSTSKFKHTTHAHQTLLWWCGCSDSSVSILCLARPPPSLYDYINVTGEQQKQKGARNWLIHKKGEYRGHNPTSEAGGQRLGGANCPKRKGFFGEREIDGLHW